MYDLTTLSRLNAEGHAKSIKTAQDAGKYVVATYAGLTLLSTQVFDTVDSAIAAQTAAAAAPDECRRLFFPTPASNVVGARDQSEDRERA